MMKKVFLVALGFMLVASCTDTDTPSKTSNRREIKISAGLKTFVTKADENVSNFPENKTDVFSVFAMKENDKTDPEKHTVEEYFKPVHVNSSAGSVLELESTRYYPSEESDTLYFYAFGPSVDNLHFTENEESKYIIDGSQDVIWAKDKNPYTTSMNTNPRFHFKHELMKVTFAIVGGAGYVEAPIEKIIIEGTKTNLTLNDLDETITWGDEVGSIIAYDNTKEGTQSYNITSTVTEMDGCCVYLKPESQIRVSAVAGGVTYNTATVNFTGDVTKGMAHKVTLTFYPHDIGLDADITNWETGSEGAGDMNSESQDYT